MENYDFSLSYCRKLKPFVYYTAGSFVHCVESSNFNFKNAFYSLQNNFADTEKITIGETEIINNVMHHVYVTIKRYMYNVYVTIKKKRKATNIQVKVRGRCDIDEQ